ncbi:MAG: uncharacterized protein JWP87_1377 [Labilithrix sp.]|nr:uncharacterized protein [Labilithrix sp.]
MLALITVTTASACRNQETSQGGDGGHGGSGSATSAASAEAIPLPAEVQKAPSVCTLKTELFRPFAEYPVRASGIAPPYMKVGTTGAVGIARFELRADLAIPGDEDMPFWLRVVGAPVELHGLAERTFPLYAAGPLALGAFAAALPHTELHVVKATSLELEAEVQLGESVEVVDGPLRARGPCGLFAIERRDFLPTDVIPGAKWKTTPGAMLKTGRKIAVSRLPVGEAVARIQVKPTDNAAVAVFEKVSGRAHIGWFGSVVMIHGWIAESDLDPLTDAGAPKGADGGATKAAVAPSASASASASAAAPAIAPAGEHLSCPTAVPLVAKIGESRTTVGTLRPSGAFDVIARDKDWAEVRVHVPLVTITEGTRLLVRQSDLATCKPKKDDAR